MNMGYCVSFRWFRAGYHILPTHCNPIPYPRQTPSHLPLHSLSYATCSITSPHWAALNVYGLLCVLPLGSHWGNTLPIQPLPSPNPQSLTLAFPLIGNLQCHISTLGCSECTWVTKCPSVGSTQGVVFLSTHCSVTILSQSFLTCMYNYRIKIKYSLCDRGKDRS